MGKEGEMEASEEELTNAVHMHLHLHLPRVVEPQNLHLLLPNRAILSGAPMSLLARCIGWKIRLGMASRILS
jgi:hypothetical protein